VKRVIKDYKGITPAQLELIAQEYPEGFGLDDLITFKKPDGDTFKGLEIKTDDTLYLFKIDTRMLEMIDDYTDDDFQLDDFSESKDYSFDNSGDSDSDGADDEESDDNDVADEADDDADEEED
jgi:DNA-directed RNA polymerase subunit delta